MTESIAIIDGLHELQVIRFINISAEIKFLDDFFRRYCVDAFLAFQKLLDCFPNEFQRVFKFLCHAILQTIDQIRLQYVRQCREIGICQFFERCQSLLAGIKFYVNRLASWRTRCPNSP